MPRRIQIRLNTGASRMMKSAFTDCSQLAGISHPAIIRLVSRWANRFIDDPPCSNPDQKQAAARNVTAMTPTRFFSTTVSRPNIHDVKEKDRCEARDEDAGPIHDTQQRQPDRADLRQRRQDKEDSDHPFDGPQQIARSLFANRRVLEFRLSDLRRRQEISGRRSIESRQAPYRRQLR